MRWTGIACVLAVVAAFSPLALGQQGPSRGGFGGGMLLGQESVRKELKLSDEQIKKLDEHSAKQREAYQGLRDLDREARREKMTELSKSGSEAVNSILNEEQRTRYRQISLQVRGLSALGENDVAQALSLSDEQKKKVTEIQEAARQEMRGLFEGGGDRADMRKKFQEARRAVDEKLNAVLNAEQQTKWKELSGPKFEGELRAPEGGRGRRNRDSAATQSTEPTNVLTADRDEEKPKAEKKSDGDKPKAKHGHKKGKHAAKHHKKHGKHAMHSRHGRSGHHDGDRHFAHRGPRPGHHPRHFDRDRHFSGHPHRGHAGGDHFFATFHPRHRHPGHHGHHGRGPEGHRFASHSFHRHHFHGPRPDGDRFRGHGPHADRSHGEHFLASRILYGPHGPHHAGPRHFSFEARGEHSDRHHHRGPMHMASFHKHSKHKESGDCDGGHRHGKGREAKAGHDERRHEERRTHDRQASGDEKHKGHGKKDHSKKDRDDKNHDDRDHKGKHRSDKDRSDDSKSDRDDD